MSKATTLTVRVDPELKREAEDILQKLGISTSLAIRLFLKQVVLQKGLPFEITIPDQEDIPNAETLAAIEDSIHRRNIKSFDSVDEALKDLGI